MYFSMVGSAIICLISDFVWEEISGLLLNLGIYLYIVSVFTVTLHQIFKFIGDRQQRKNIDCLNINYRWQLSLYEPDVYTNLGTVMCDRYGQENITNVLRKYATTDTKVNHITHYWETIFKEFVGKIEGNYWFTYQYNRLCDEYEDRILLHLL